MQKRVRYLISDLRVMETNSFTANKMLTLNTKDQATYAKSLEKKEEQERADLHELIDVETLRLCQCVKNAIIVTTSEETLSLVDKVEQELLVFLREMAPH